MPTLETQIADIADEIAYDNHDLDDGLTSGLLKESDLEKLKIWYNICKDISVTYPKLTAQKRKYLIIRSLIDIQVSDLIAHTDSAIKQLRLRSARDVKLLGKKVVSSAIRCSNCAGHCGSY